MALPTESLIMFDLDGTLAESKMPITKEMSKALALLFAKKRVAIISGGAWQQFQKEVVTQLSSDSALENLFLMPASGTCLYDRKENMWKNEYEEKFTPEEKETIIKALRQAVENNLPIPEQVYGERIEDRGSQITFSALGQEAPLAVKETWDKDQAKRKLVLKELTPALLQYEVRMGGTTSIDITKKGEDKSYGIKKLAAYLMIPLADILYVGDALYEGGNDYAAKELGLHCIQVKNEKETLSLINGWLA